MGTVISLQSLRVEAKFVWSRRKWLVRVIGSTTIAAWLIVFFLPTKYRVITTILPLESRPTAIQSVMRATEGMNLFSALANGTMGGLAGSNATDKLVNILRSRTVSERVINKLGLMPVFFHKYDYVADHWKFPRSLWKRHAPYLDDGVAALQGVVDFGRERKGLLTVQVRLGNPELAAKIANQYVAELQEFINGNSLSLAKKNRVFLEGQLLKTQKTLAAAEEDLKDFQAGHNLVNLERQTDLTMRTAANLQAEMIRGDVQISMLRSSGRGEGPEEQALLRQKEALQTQLDKLDRTDATSLGQSRGSLNKTTSMMTQLGRTPALMIQLMRLKREVIIQEQVFELLTGQYELAKIDEVKDDVAFQVIDPAVPVAHPFWPDRRGTVFTVFLLTTLFSVYATVKRWPIISTLDV
ncbi:MAG: hypothetical protein V1495_06740 [Pseudomonadota bacterium]